jgi:SAM-dependent methyltransferase
MTTCIACTGRETTETPSSIAPFVVHRAGLDSDATMTVHCTECGCRFSSVRLNEKQNHRLYAGYRGSEYTAQREAFEPGYTERNATLEQPRDYLNLVEQLITSVGVEVTNVLDIGGGNGKNTPFKNASRTVYDLASKPDDRAYDYHVETTWSYDVVVLSHILEHVPDPRALVNEARGYLNSRGVLYIEVPNETPRRVWHEHMTQFTPQALYAVIGSHRVLRARSVDTSRGAVHMVVAR